MELTDIEMNAAYDDFEDDHIMNEAYNKFERKEKLWNKSCEEFKDPSLRLSYYAYLCDGTPLDLTHEGYRELQRSIRTSSPKFKCKSVSAWRVEAYESEWTEKEKLKERFCEKCHGTFNKEHKQGCKGCEKCQLEEERKKERERKERIQLAKLRKAQEKESRRIIKFDIPIL